MNCGLDLSPGAPYYPSCRLSDSRRQQTRQLGLVYLQIHRDLGRARTYPPRLESYGDMLETPELPS